MQADVFTRVVLVLILACLVALVAREFGVGDESSRAATRGRYSITMARRGGDFVVLRTDTHEGEVSQTMLKAGGPWKILGSEPLEPPTPTPPQPAVPEPVAPQP